MGEIRFEIYQDENGRSPFLDWYDDLPAKDARKLDAVIARIQEHGIVVALKMQWVKKLDDDIWEIRSQYAGNIQRVCYFHMDGSRYIITHGFTKKTQKTPPREIRRAHAIMTAYRQEREE